MNDWSVRRRIVAITLVAGTLDIAAAMLTTLKRGRDILAMLRGIASGPLPGATEWGVGGAALGLLVHFVLIAVMAAVFVFAADRIGFLKRQPLVAGLAYGVATWAVMNLVVLPLRWPVVFPHFDAVSVFTQLACHIFLVGIPTALIARR